MTSRRNFMASAAAMAAVSALPLAAQPAPIRLRTLMGDYPNTTLLRRGQITSPALSFDFADVKAPADAFKRVVRDLEFELAELSVVTFLIARSFDKPFVLIPAVMFSRLQHPYLLYNAERGVLAPRDLEGRRVAVAYYTTTTSTWLRGVLMTDYGVDIGKIKWVAFEDPHLAEFRDPPNVERVPKQDMVAMLLSGQVDAIVLAPAPNDPRIRPVIPDAKSAAEAWQKRNNSLQLNHMVVMRRELADSRPEVVREVYGLLRQAKAQAGLPKQGELDLVPYGVEANRRNLDVAIDNIFRQGLIPRRFSVDELYSDVTRGMN